MKSWAVTINVTYSDIFIYDDFFIDKPARLYKLTTHSELWVYVE